MSRPRFHKFEPESSSSNYCKCGLHQLDADHNEVYPMQPEPGPNDLRPVSDEIKALKNRIEDLLGKTGEFGTCRGCMEGIYWYTANPKGAKQRIAYNRDGSNHFSTCVRQHEFTKPKVAVAVDPSECPVCHTKVENGVCGRAAWGCKGVVSDGR